MHLKKKLVNHYKNIVYKIKNKINLDTQTLNLKSLMIYLIILALIKVQK